MSSLTCLSTEKEKSFAIGKYDLLCFKITLSCPWYGSASSIRKVKFVYPPDNGVMDFATHGVEERYCATC